MEYKIERSSRLDQAVRENAGFSVRRAKDCIKEGQVRVNGHLVKKPAFSVRAGDVLRLLEVSTEEAIATPSETKPKQDEFDLPILYEDETLVVINKPSGLLSVPNTGGGREKSALDRVQIYLKAKEQRAYAVHRLDRAASGLLILAKTFPARETLMAEFKLKKAQKSYLTLVCGAVGKAKGTIETPIDDNGFSPKVIVGRGKPAVSHYEVVQQSGDFSLLRVETKTGRRHQVRAHLAEALFPIYGDDLYGKPIEREDLRGHCNRLFLHAEHIEFHHPKGGRKLTLDAPLTGDLTALLTAIKIHEPFVN